MYKIIATRIDGTTELIDELTVLRYAVSFIGDHLYSMYEDGNILTVHVECENKIKFKAEFKDR